MTDPICSVCFQNPSLYTRSCLCLYCQGCYESSKSLCECGGTGGFSNINQEIVEYIINTQPLSDLFLNIGDTLCSIIHQNIKLEKFISKNSLSVIEHNKQMRIQKMIAEIKSLEIKKNFIGDIETDLTLSTRRSSSRDIQDTPKFDFSPFDYAWSKISNL